MKDRISDYKPRKQCPICKHIGRFNMKTCSKCKYPKGYKKTYGDCKQYVGNGAPYTLVTKEKGILINIPILKDIWYNSKTGHSYDGYNSKRSFDIDFFNKSIIQIKRVEK